MNNLYKNIAKISGYKNTNKEQLVKKALELLISSGYEIAEVDIKKPWGAFIRIVNNQSNRFIDDFFKGLSVDDARLGNKEAELSPKILIVQPGKRLSWQYHNRRAERWVFLSDGAYMRSDSDDETEVKHAAEGDVLQFKKGERHRLISDSDSNIVVAEIWQHVDPKNLSNEDDIIRIQDDFKR